MATVSGNKGGIRKRRRLNNNEEGEAKKIRRSTRKTNTQDGPPQDVLHSSSKDKANPRKKRQRKVMTKRIRDELQTSLESIDSDVLVLEVVVRVREQLIADSDGRCTDLVNKLCEAKQLLTELAEFHRDTFVALHIECKKQKNSQLKFQLRWYTYCSAFLLEEQYSLSDIHLNDNDHPVLTELRRKWLDFCKDHCTSIAANKPIMMAFSTALYNTLLEHVSSFQASQTNDTGNTVIPTSEEDGVYYCFGGGALCEMLYRRYKQISCSSNKNLMSIEISILQAINTKDKSDVPKYLQYQDRGFMYFPHKIFIPFLRKLDTSLKNFVNLDSFNKHGDSLIKVSHYYCLLSICALSFNRLLTTN